jgi:ABC-type sugar transport system substrate-binding protein
MRVRWAILAVLAMACGCGEQLPDAPAEAPPSDDILIGYSAPEWGGGQHHIMEGLRRRAEQRGWSLFIVNANFDADLQARQLNFLVDRQVDAIVVVPLEGDGISSAEQRAREAGIPVFAIDRAPARIHVELVVQADNVLAGQQAAEALLPLLHQRYGRVTGTILQLRGEMSQSVAQQRDAGFKSVFEPYPGITIIDRDTGWEPHLFAEHANALLSSTHVDAIYLQSDMIGVPEVLPVLASHHRLHPSDHPEHVFIVGIDGGTSALNAIRKDHVSAVACQPLDEFGIVAHFIERRLHGEEIAAGPVTIDGKQLEIVASESGPLLLLPTMLVTESNVDDLQHWANRTTLEATRSP